MKAKQILLQKQLVALHIKQTAMALRIQCAWRQKRARMQVQIRRAENLAYENQLNDCALRLQRHWRGRVGRLKFNLKLANKVAEEKRREASALKLQRIFRGRAARKRTTSMRRVIDYKASRKAKSAVRMQAIIRRFQARLSFAHALNNHTKLVKATRLVQKTWRSKQSLFTPKLIAQILRASREETAARRLQSAWRRKQGTFASHILHLARGDEYYIKEAAARKLQHIWRGKKYKDDYHRTRANALESVIMKARIEYNAASLIQARWKGIKAREVYQTMLLDKKNKWKTIYNEETHCSIYYVRNRERFI